MTSKEIPWVYLDLDYHIITIENRELILGMVTYLFWKNNSFGDTRPTSSEMCNAKILSLPGQSRPTAGKAYTGSSGRNTVLGYSQCLTSQLRRSARLMIHKCYMTNRGNQLTSFVWKRYVTTDLWSKYVTSLTQGSNWPPLVKKCYNFHAGLQLTF